MLIFPHSRINIVMELHTLIPKLYRDKKLATSIVKKIHNLAKNLDYVKIMNFCGTHEYTITYYGIRTLMPKNVELIAGPGCPVCIVPACYIDAAVKLSLEGIRVYTYGDMFRVPGSKMSLLKAKSLGGNVVIVYGFLDVLKDLEKYHKEAVFFAVGFETTQPTLATYLVRNKIPNNLKILVAYRLTPPIMRHILLNYDVDLNGVIAPGHVSSIIGSLPWIFVPNQFNIPTVVAGFEPIDVLLAVYYILKQLVNKEAKLVNEYSRVVRPCGNVLAKRLVFKCMKVVNGTWRGIGLVPRSGLSLREAFKEYDAAMEYGLELKGGIDVRPGCKCHEIIIGKAKPTDCPLFGKVCTPSTPYGPCMVSTEGTCYIWFKYGGSKVDLLRKFSKEI